MKPSLSSGGVMRWMRIGIASIACVTGVTTLGAGCLNRPVGEQSPRVSNIFVDQIAQNAVDKIDLLFMVDNSVSMQDKQFTLQDAVPALVSRLITPVCIDAEGNRTGAIADENGKCASGEPEFKPIRDIHIGVITSSLGGYGGTACTPAMGSSYDPSMEDNAHLLTGRNGTTVDTGGLDFLNWAPGQPGGESNAAQLKANFQTIIEATGEKGCGYEASLEAWYRFLIDPEPPASIGVKDGRMTFQGLDNKVLTQRKNFLRPDSLVAIVMLTDENDCSVAAFPGSLGFFVTADHALRATSACDSDPNSLCCRTCATAESAPPSGCTAISDDTECKKGALYGSADPDDHLNLRCYKQKQRFGLNFLWDTSRYVDGLTKAKIKNYAGDLVPNPLFTAAEGQPSRPPSLVFLAGIIGVPWQDVATQDSLSAENTDNLNYLTYNQLTELKRWDVMLGDPASGKQPTDGLMIESVEPRTGKSNPIINAPIAPITSINPQENPINGHEADYSSLKRDLQYACIYRLPPAQVKNCANGGSCDCKPDDPLSEGDDSDLRFNRPLCNPPGGGPAGTTQYWAKAYPGIRELQVLKDFGAVTTNSIVASICPKIPDPANKDKPGYGYSPAVAALVDRLKEQLGGKCLSRKLTIKKNGEVPCKIVETLRIEGQTCGASGEPAAGCDENKGRLVVDAKLGKAVREQLKNVAKSCGGADQPPCEEFCMCEISALKNDPNDPNDAADKCQNLADDAQVEALPTPGYCYVDPLPPPAGQGIGSLDAIKSCKETEPRRLRFAGANTPANGSITFIACLGEDPSATDTGTATDGGS